MVHATFKGESVLLDSSVEITEGEKERIKQNDKVVKALLNDLHAEHFLSSTEDGSAISTLHIAVKAKDFKAEKDVKTLKTNHKSFIKAIDELDLSKNEEPKVENPEEDDKIFGILLIPMFV